MESEKVKEIKKALECCQGESLKSCEHCPYWNWCKEDDGLTFKSDILTLINELESENAEWKEIFDICNKREYRNKFNDEWRKEYQKELDKENDGAIAGLPDFDLVYKLYFEQKDRIAELEKQNAKLLDSIETVQNDRCVFKCELTKKHLKQFAERLKIECVNKIHETLKEFIDG